MNRGKLIVLYGINNLGKTTQAKILLQRLKNEGLQVKYLKFPIYDLKPSGPLLNSYLRESNPDNLSPGQAQELYAQNRQDYSEKLEQTLTDGIFVVAEDYWGTGVAWGIGAGVDKDFLLDINKEFRNEDLAILLRGKRFLDGKEDNHRHEQDEVLTSTVSKAHDELAKDFEWKIVNANQNVEQVAHDIWKNVKPILE